MARAKSRTRAHRRADDSEMWIEVTAPQYDHLFPSRAMRTYVRGRHCVPRAVGEAAISRGKAVAVETPPREQPADGEGQ